MKNILFAVLVLSVGLLPSPAFTVDAQQVASAAMNKNVAVNVILPDSYQSNSSDTFPVLYLLHGAGDNQDTWLKNSPIGSLADQYGIIVVCPDADQSWYFDSPEDPKYRYETFVSSELVSRIDGKYRTRPDRKYRALAGNSMGGHGALFLAIRHKDAFSIASSLSGGVDFRPFPDNWNLKNLLGSIQDHPDRWNDLVVVNQAKSLKDGDLAISMEVGTSDFFLAVNRALHQELLYRKISHDYAERPGEHGWPYWANAIKYQMLFISDHFKKVDFPAGNAHP